MIMYYYNLNNIRIIMLICKNNINEIGGKSA